MVKKQGEGMICQFCAKIFELSDLKDEISKREAKISSLCQECQDAVFREEEDDL